MLKFSEQRWLGKKAALLSSRWRETFTYVKFRAAILVGSRCPLTRRLSWNSQLRYKLYTSKWKFLASIISIPSLIKDSSKLLAFETNDLRCKSIQQCFVFEVVMVPKETK